MLHGVILFKTICANAGSETLFQTNEWLHLKHARVARWLYWNSKTRLFLTLCTSRSQCMNVHTPSLGCVSLNIYIWQIRSGRSFTFLIYCKLRGVFHAIFLPHRSKLACRELLPGKTLLRSRIIRFTTLLPNAININNQLGSSAIVQVWNFQFDSSTDRIYRRVHVNFSFDVWFFRLSGPLSRFPWEAAIGINILAVYQCWIPLFYSES